MSLYAEYVKERLDWKTIEVEDGFITYSIKPPEAAIEEFYVRPSSRGTPLAKRLADFVVREARTAGAKRLWARIVPGTAGADQVLMMDMKYGFKLHSADGGSILLRMDLGG